MKLNSYKRFFLWNRILNVFLCISLFITYIPAEINIGSSFSSNKNKNFLSEMILPKDCGEIREIFCPEKEFSNKTIVLLQDAHCNELAQIGIEKNLEYLSKTYGIDLIGVEGARGPVPSDLFQKGTLERRNQVATEYVKKGLLTGVESFLMKFQDERNLVVQGLEDKNAYLENFIALKDTFTYRSEMLRLVEAMDSLLFGLLDKVIKEEPARQFLQKHYSFRKGELARKDFFLFIHEFYTAHKNRFKDPDLLNLYDEETRFDTFVRISKIALMERDIDFSAVREEEKVFWEKAKNVLTEKDINEINQSKIDYSEKKITALDYYGKMTAFSNLHDFGFMTEMKKYLEVIKIFAESETETLLEEMRTIVYKIKLDLCKNPEEKEYVCYETVVSVLDRLFNLHLTRDQLLFFKNQSDYFRPQILFTWIKEIALKEGIRIPKEVILSENLYPFVLKAASDYYHGLIRRDHLLLQNLVEVMDSQEIDRAFLVAGGFHTNGISDLLKKKGIAYVVISPRVSKPNDLYYEIMLDLGPVAEAAFDQMQVFGLARVLVSDTGLGLSNYGLIQEILHKLEENSVEEAVTKNQGNDFNIRNLLPYQRSILLSRLEHLRDRFKGNENVLELLDDLGRDFKGSKDEARDTRILKTLDLFGNGQFSRAFQYVGELVKPGKPSFFKKGPIYRYFVGLTSLSDIKFRAKNLSRRAATLSPKDLKSEIQKIANDAKKEIVRLEKTINKKYRDDFSRIQDKILYYLNESLPSDVDQTKVGWEKGLIDESEERIKFLFKNPQEFRKIAFHGTGSAVLSGIKQSQGKLMSLKALQDEGIVRTTGEGVALSDTLEPKRQVYICKVSEEELGGMGASFAYSKATMEMPEYNIQLYTYSQLLEKIQTLKKAIVLMKHRLHQAGSDIGGTEHNTFLDSFLGKMMKNKLNFNEVFHQRGKYEMELAKLEKELVLRDKYPEGHARREGGAVLREDSFPILFEFNHDGLETKDENRAVGGRLSGESTVDYSLDLHNRIRRAYAPAKFVPLLRNKLKDIYGQDVEVLAMEAVQKVFSDQEADSSIGKEKNVSVGRSALKKTYDGIQSAQTSVHGFSDFLAEAGDHLVQKTDCRQKLLDALTAFDLTTKTAAIDTAIRDYNLKPTVEGRNLIRRLRKEFRDGSKAALAWRDIINAYMNVDLTSDDTLRQKYAELDQILDKTEYLYASEELLFGLKSMLSPQELAARSPEQVATPSEKLKVDAFNPENISSTLQQQVVNPLYKQVFTYRYRGPRIEYRSGTAAEITALAGKAPFFGQLKDGIRIDNYFDYIDILTGQVPGKTFEVPRQSHGALHATRVTFYTELLARFHVSKGTKAKGDEKGEGLLDNLGALKVAMGLHDAGRMDDGQDFYDPISADLTKAFFAGTNLDKTLQTRMHSVVAYKDEELDHGVDEISKLQHDIVHDSDVLDVVRAKANFDPNYLRVFKSLDSVGKEDFKKILEEVKNFISLTSGRDVVNKLELESIDLHMDLFRILKYTLDKYRAEDGKSSLFPKMEALLADTLKGLTYDSVYFGKLIPLLDAKIKDTFENSVKLDDTGNALRFTGNPEQYQATFKQLATRNSEFHLMALSAKSDVIKADLGEGINLMAYNFFHEGRRIIVLNTNASLKKKVGEVAFDRIESEVLYHEKREDLWRERLARDKTVAISDKERFAHILASVEQATTFGTEGLTEFHKIDINAKTPEELKSLIDEYFTLGKREIHKQAVAWAIKNGLEVTQEMVDNYERKFIARVMERLYETGGVTEKKIVSDNLETLLKTLNSSTVFTENVGKTYFTLNGQIQIHPLKLLEIFFKGDLKTFIDKIVDQAKTVSVPIQDNDDLIKTDGYRMRTRNQLLTKADDWITKHQDVTGFRDFWDAKKGVDDLDSRMRLFDLVNDAKIGDQEAKRAIEYALYKTPGSIREFANHYTFYLGFAGTKVIAKETVSSEYDKLNVSLGTVEKVTAFPDGIISVTRDVVESKIRSLARRNELHFESIPAFISHAQKHPVSPGNVDVNQYLTWARRVVKEGDVVLMRRNQTDGGMEIHYKLDSHTAIVRVDEKGEAFIASYMPRDSGEGEIINVTTSPLVLANQEKFYEKANNEREQIEAFIKTIKNDASLTRKNGKNKADGNYLITGISAPIEIKFIKSGSNTELITKTNGSPIEYTIQLDKAVGYLDEDILGHIKYFVHQILIKEGIDSKSLKKAADEFADFRINVIGDRISREIKSGKSLGSIYQRYQMFFELMGIKGDESGSNVRDFIHRRVTEILPELLKNQQNLADKEQLRAENTTQHFKGLEAVVVAIESLKTDLSTGIRQQSKRLSKMEFDSKVIELEKKAIEFYAIKDLDPLILDTMEGIKETLDKLKSFEPDKVQFTDLRLPMDKNILKKLSEGLFSMVEKHKLDELTAEFDIKRALDQFLILQKEMYQYHESNSGFKGIDSSLRGSKLSKVSPRTIEHLLFPTLKENDFENSGISGGHVENYLREFASANPRLHLIERESIRVECGSGQVVTLKLFDQYLWRGDGLPPTGLSARPKAGDTSSTNWIKAQIPKTTTDNLSYMLRLGEEAFLRWEQRGYFDKKGPHAQRFGRDGFLGVNPFQNQALTEGDIEFTGFVNRRGDGEFEFSTILPHVEWFYLMGKNLQKEVKRPVFQEFNEIDLDTQRFLSFMGVTVISGEKEKVLRPLFEKGDKSLLIRELATSKGDSLSLTTCSPINFNSSKISLKMGETVALNAYFRNGMMYSELTSETAGIQRFVMDFNQLTPRLFAQGSMHEIMQRFDRIIAPVPRLLTLPKALTERETTKKTGQGGMIGGGTMGMVRRDGNRLFIKEKDQVEVETSLTSRFLSEGEKDMDTESFPLDKDGNANLVKVQKEVKLLLEGLDEGNEFYKALGLDKTKIKRAGENIEKRIFTFQSKQNSEGKYFLGAGLSRSETKQEIGFDQNFLKLLMNHPEIAKMALFHEALEGVTDVGTHDNIRKLQKSIQPENDVKLTHLIRAFNLAMQLHSSLNVDVVTFADRLYKGLIKEDSQVIDDLLKEFLKGTLDLTLFDQIVKAAETADIHLSSKLLGLAYKGVLLNREDAYDKFGRMLIRLGVPSYEVKGMVAALEKIFQGSRMEQDKFQSLSDEAENVLSVMGYRLLYGMEREAKRELAGQLAHSLSGAIMQEEKKRSTLQRKVERILLSEDLDMEWVKRDSENFSSASKALIERYDGQLKTQRQFEAFLSSQKDKVFGLNPKFEVRKTEAGVLIRMINGNIQKDYNESEFQKKFGMSLLDAVRLKGAMLGDPETSERSKVLRTETLRAMESETFKDGERKTLFVLSEDMKDSDLKELAVYLKRVIQNKGNPHIKLGGAFENIRTRLVDLGYLDEVLSLEAINGFQLSGSLETFRNDKPLLVIGAGASTDAYTRKENVVVLDSRNSFLGSLVGVTAFMKRDVSLLEDLNEVVEKTKQEPIQRLAEAIRKNNFKNVDKIIFPELKPILESLLNQLADEEETILIAG